LCVVVTFSFSLLDPETTKPTQPPKALAKIKIPPKEEGMKIFDQLDMNGNGMLSLAELDRGIVESYPQYNHKPAIMAAYKSADRSEDGYVTRGEFGYFLRYIHYYNHLWSLFESLDADGDRRISREEFKKVASVLPMSEDPDVVFDKVDTNKGGMILFDEFCRFMATQDDSEPDKKEPTKDQTPAAAPTLSEEEEESKQPEESTTPKKASHERVPHAVLKVAIPPKAEALKMFDQCDVNGNGMLSLAELDKAIVELKPVFNNKPAIMRAYKASDRNNDGFVRRGEFYFFLKFIQYYNDLWEVFDAVDTSDDRRITRAEFEQASFLLELGDLNPDDVFDKIDTNKGGYILFDEFCVWKARLDDKDS